MKAIITLDKKEYVDLLVSLEFIANFLYKERPDMSSTLKRNVSLLENNRKIEK